MTIPALVVRALALAEARGFRHSSCLEAGLLLHALASTVTGGRIGEIGTGCGVGTAWMVSALQPNVGCVTIDSDPQLVAAVRDVFAISRRFRCCTVTGASLWPTGHSSSSLQTAATRKRHTPTRCLGSSP